jgi:hypothetical protein
MNEMINWEQEIVTKNMERTLSIVFQLQNVNDFEKSITENKLAVDGDRVEKSGVEIKEKLQVELSEIQTVTDQNLTKMSSLVKSIGELPADSMDRKLIKGFENHITELPRQYGFDQIYADQALVKGREMRDFNQTALSFVKSRVEELKLRAVIANLPDEKMVQMSKALADQLGF